MNPHTNPRLTRALYRVASGTADPCFLLKVIHTPDGRRRTAGTLTGGMYATPWAAMEAAERTVWAVSMDGNEWRSDDGEWIVRRAQSK